MSNQTELFDEDPSFGLDEAELGQLSTLLDKVIASIEQTIPIEADRRLQKLRAAWVDGAFDEHGPRGFGPGGPGFGPGFGGGFGPGFGGGPRGGRGGRPGRPGRGHDHDRHHGHGDHADH